MKLTFKAPPVHRLIERDRQRLERAHYKAAMLSTDEASAEARVKVQGKIRAVGLGRLAQAVGQTSAKRKAQTPKTPYGVIYVKGGDASRAGQALEAYTHGVTIRARKGNWLAFATNAVPRTIGRRRTTPELYKRSGMNVAIGQLEFRPIRPGLAFLVVKNVTLHPRTHRAKRAGPGRTRTRIPQKEVVAFVLIKVTRRAFRFNQKRIVAREAKTVPDRFGAHLEKLLASPVA